jgi:hypothetical protein
MFFKKKPKVKKQDALFAEAIRETGIVAADGELTISHEKAECYYNRETYPIMFPLRFLRESRNLEYFKKYDFTFRGLQTPKRDWVKQFESGSSQITFTDAGRKIGKDQYDKEYYQEMASSKFTLCPAGDFKWTYRFLEAMMCRSIPVIERGFEHEQCEGVVYFYSDAGRDQLISQWKEEIVEKNYKLFLKRHTFINRFIFL